MKKLIQKWLIKNIVKILIIYKNSIEKNMFKNYLDDKIYFELEFLIKLIKERVNQMEDMEVDYYKLKMKKGVKNER